MLAFPPNMKLRWFPLTRVCGDADVATALPAAMSIKPAIPFGWVPLAVPPSDEKRVKSGLIVSLELLALVRTVASNVKLKEASLVAVTEITPHAALPMAAPSVIAAEALVLETQVKIKSLGAPPGMTVPNSMSDAVIIREPTTSSRVFPVVWACANGAKSNDEKLAAAMSCFVIFIFFSC